MKNIFFSFLLFFSFFPAFGQKDFSVMFYNFENLFDTIDNPLTRDEEYTPNGEKRWTSKRYNTKLKHLRQVISAVDLESFPDIIGVCEIENRRVLEDLINKPPLSEAGYRIFHRETSDRRGIDCAVLYNPETFKILDTNVLRIQFEDTTYFSRDILYVKGKITGKKDTLHIFVNHWPSRFGGHSQTEKLRYQAALRLRFSTDSIFKTNPNAKILCIGDFNDTPEDRSVTEGLKAKTSLLEISPSTLYNLSYYLQFEKKLWTYCFHEDYDILDQVIVSGALLEKKTLFAEPFKRDFMLKTNENGNPRPWRTFYGYKYEGGFSDHLPMVIKWKE